MAIQRTRELRLPLCFAPADDFDTVRHTSWMTRSTRFYTFRSVVDDVCVGVILPGPALLDDAHLDDVCSRPLGPEGFVCMLKHALRFASWSLLLALAACHPAGCFHPPGLNPDTPLTLSGQGVDGDVDIYVDNMGVPHIFADNKNDLMYGLGFMHARERLFQVTVFKHASQGRLSELLGESYLNADRFLRIYSYNLDAQMAAFSDRDMFLLESYTAGLNAGKEHAGNSAEMNLLSSVYGAEFEPFTVRDIAAIIRLQQDDQSTALVPELARAFLQSQLATDDPRYDALVRKVPAEGIPIVRKEEHVGLDNFRPAQQVVSRSTLTSQPQTLYSPDKSALHKPRRQLSKKIQELLQKVNHRGASNSWAVDGAHTDEGVPVLLNDPHLGHSAPGIFYMVHMETPDYMAAGVSFPGLPAVLIGHGRHIAWGITNSFADAQDLVRITPYSGRDDMYLLDGVAQNYGRITQTYKLGAGEDAPVYEETWRTTVFGPLLPSGWSHRTPDDGFEYAYMWTAQQYPEESSHLMSSWMDIAASENMDDALDALQRFTAPPMNFAMAFTDGTIGYHTSGIIPVRLSDESVTTPRDGRFSSAGWGDPVPYVYKPTLRNPERGWLVSSNQRIVDDDGPISHLMGGEAANPHRAMRITELVEAAVEDGSASADELLAIQQDSRSAQAARLLPILQEHCPSSAGEHDDQLVANFCQAIRDFDGNFVKDSMGAMPFFYFLKGVQEHIMQTHLGERGLEIARVSFVDLALEHAMLNEAKSEEEGRVRSPLLDDPATSGREGLGGMIAGGTARAIDQLVEQAGPDPANWRYGNHHKLSFEGLLSGVPAVGEFFKTPATEQDGCHTCVRAEGRIPVTFGAGLRLQAVMTDPPAVRMIIDNGNSGHFGNVHLTDQHERWTNGDPMQLPMTVSEIEQQLEGKIELRP